MPIYEYYCPDNNRIYQFFAKTIAQGATTPKCPDNPTFRMVKIVSGFAIGGRQKKAASDEAALPASDGSAAGEPGGGGESMDPAREAKLESAFAQLEGEMSSIDENDPRAMGRMMRRMSELTGEKLDGEMDEMVRKLEEGQDPDKLEEELGGALGDGDEEGGMGGGMGGGFSRAPSRDPGLYDY